MATTKNRRKTLITLSVEEVQPQFRWVESIRKAPIPIRFPTATGCYSLVFSRFLSINERQALENFLNVLYFVLTAYKRSWQFKWIT